MRQPVGQTSTAVALGSLLESTARAIRIVLRAYLIGWLIRQVVRFGCAISGGSMVAGCLVVGATVLLGIPILLAVLLQMLAGP